VRRSLLPWLVTVSLLAALAVSAADEVKHDVKGGVKHDVKADTKGSVTLRADRQEWVKDTFWKGTGHVQILYQDIKITCDEMVLDTDTMELDAHGNVVLDQGPRRMTADHVRFNLRTKTGTFFDATGQVAPSYYFTGKEVVKVDETHYKLKNATFTSCSPDPRPPWRFRIHRASIEEEGYGSFHGVSLEAKGVPVFYLPYLLWPVKTERATGLLVPTFGFSSRRGTYIGNALYIAAARSWDTTLYVDAYSKGTVGFGDQLRWAPKEKAYGEVTLYTIRNQDTGGWEWKVDGKHQQEDFHGFRMLAEVHDMSNLDFFREYERNFDINTQRSLYSYLYLTRSWGPYALNIRADHRKTFLTGANVVLNQLPEVELRVRQTRVGNSSLYWSLISSANVFNVDRGGNLTSTYGRADFFPQLSYTLPGPPWLTVTPQIGARGTYYTARKTQDGLGFENKGIDRSYVEAGLDLVGPSFSRIFTPEHGPYSKLKHLFQPRIEYSYVSDIGNNLLIPRFDEVDSALVTNRVRLTLGNQLFGRPRKGSSAQELASFDIYQDYSFSDPLNRSSNGTVTSRHGPLGVALRLTPKPGYTLDARVEYDTLFRHLRTTSLSASAYSGATGVNLTWYQGFIPETGKTTSSQVRAALRLGTHNRRLQANLEVAYDMEQKKFQQQRAVMRYQGSCWGLDLEYRDLRFGTYPSRDYRISIDFKGIGRLLDIRGGLSSLSK